MKSFIEFVLFPGPKIGTWGTHSWYKFKRSET